ncbi:TIGR03915 family putative DNA repair protein [Lachnospiraceae bacterium LCP25S3_G4]
MKQIYVCSDTVTGIFSGIYDVWKTGLSMEQVGIALQSDIQPQLFCEYLVVEELEKKAIAVEQLIKMHLGMEVYWELYHAVLSDNKEKGNAILGTMLEAKQIPNAQKIMNHLSCSYVQQVFEMSRSVKNEAHLYTGFVRFKELENGILCAIITPKSQVLTCIADHFSNRLPLEHFMIYDKTHQMFLVHKANAHWVLVVGEQLNMDAVDKVSIQEKEMQQLWTGFFQSIAIEERRSDQRQMAHLPLHYRQDMVEFE